MGDTSSSPPPVPSPSSAPLRMGLVGAGPWAQAFTGPMIAASNAVAFTGIWARRPEAATALAVRFDTMAYADLDALFDACDAITFSVPPSVQASLAPRAAAAGKALLLDKPVGGTVAEAEQLAAAIDAAGVISQVILTNRYLDAMRDFLARAATFDAYGGRASFFGDGCLEGTYFGTPWRIAEGGLLDLGPHVLDALDAALGRIESIAARGDVHRLVLLELTHAGGAISQAAISATTHQAGGLAVELHGPDGKLALDVATLGPGDIAGAQQRIIAELVECVRSGTPHPLDVHRGLHLQRLIDEAGRQLRSGA